MPEPVKKPTKRSRKRTDKKPKKGERYSSFRLQKKIEVDISHIPSVWTVISEAYRLLVHNKRLIVTMTVIYGVLYAAFLRVSGGFSVADTQAILDLSTLGEEQFLNDLDTSSLVLSTTFGVDAGFNGAVGLIATVVASLAFIYAFRRILVNKKITAREAYYFGPEQIVPFSLLIILIVIQLIPFAAGAVLLNEVFFADIVVGIGEYAIFIGVWLGLSLLSAYWLTGSLMSLYAISLPKMHPFKTLMATAELIHHKRWIIFRKILFIIVFILLFNIALILLAVWQWPDGAFIMRDVAAVLSLPLYHSFMFSLYRKII